MEWSGDVDGPGLTGLARVELTAADEAGSDARLGAGKSGRGDARHTEEIRAGQHHLRMNIYLALGVGVEGQVVHPDHKLVLGVWPG